MLGLAYENRNVNSDHTDTIFLLTRLAESQKILSEMWGDTVLHAVDWYSLCGAVRGNT